MQQFSNTNVDMVVLNRGEEVMAQLGKYAKERNLASAWMSGLGGSGSVTLEFYNPSIKEYEWKKFNVPLEILNLTGNLSWVDGEPFWHVHGTFSGRDLQSIGGHVKELVVGLTCEILVAPLETPMTRVFDEGTGLMLLQNQQNDPSALA